MSEPVVGTSCKHKCEDPADPPKSFSQWAYDLGFTVAQAASPDGMPSEPWSPIGDFLELLGGIEEVDIDMGRFDASQMMCGRARDYNDLHSDVVTKYGTDLTRFLLAFNVLEETCVATGFKERGQDLNHTADRIANFLEANYKFSILKLYRCTIAALLCNGSRSDYHGGLSKIHRIDGEPTSGTGVRLAYWVRNRLIHEGFAFPNEPRSRPGADQGVMTGAASLALFTVQMMAMCSFDSHRIRIQEPHRRIPESARAEVAAVHLHREPPDELDDYEILE